ncbi:PIN-like domain-containing protein [Pseudomonas sp.]|uniref:PIN-like domain-containing protein n=1 Tax=Pseudomonas sp. TaxID=306 RepID=UPI002614C18C|nr:PIN-like domain-containing protein [Pseudomonas sp.]
MRDHFFEYFRPTEEETKALWGEAVFVFDTNVLLNLYRVSANTSIQLREVFNLLKGRLFLPNQVGAEFFKHAEYEIAKQVNAFAAVKRDLQKIPREFGKEFSRHPCIPIADIAQALQECVKAQIERVEQSQEENQLNFLFNDDPILSELNSLFAGSSEPSYTDDGNAALNKLVEERILQNDAPCSVAPTSAAMASLEKNPHRGDGRVWFQLVKHAEAVRKPLVFVTGDMQGNWWRTAKLGNDEKPVGPHFALIRDIQRASGEKFWMYTQEQFLLMAPTYLGASDQSASISEIKLLQDFELARVAAEFSDEPKTVAPVSVEKNFGADADTESGFREKEIYPEEKSETDFPDEAEKEQPSQIEKKDS